MEMASTCIDRVLLQLELLYNHIGQPDSRAEGAIRATKFLKTFLMCARKWNHSNDMYLESDNVVKQVSLPSFLSCIEDTLRKHEEDIRPLFFISETDARVRYALSREVSYKFVKQIKSFKQEIIRVYFTLASSRSLQSNSGMTDDELMEFIDLILTLSPLSHALPFVIPIAIFIFIGSAMLIS